LTTVAITDHDTTEGWADASAAARHHGIALVPGVEISCTRDGASVHLLGYLVDPADAPLTDALARVRISRRTRMQAIVELMAADGIPITYDEVLAQVQPGATLGRPHLADALIASGIVRTRDEAFAGWLHNSSRYYVRHYAPDAADAIRLVRGAGGVAVLAHPFPTARGYAVTPALVEELAAAGLTGIEVGHRAHPPDVQASTRDLSRRLGLVETGSSDYHGIGKVNRLGEHTTDADALAEIEARASGVAVIR
ncbi:MAG TPA: PHP domain-containing protein, partial [Candidatus Lustribacter sp.]|nr:PHP domain-containing protein [Candidatus Lustribacter sp.]